MGQIRVCKIRFVSTNENQGKLSGMQEKPRHAIKHICLNGKDSGKSEQLCSLARTFNVPLFLV